MKKMLPLVAALFAAATTALADLYVTLTVNGTPYTQGGAGWSFDGATVSLTNAGPFVLSTGGATFTDDVGIVAAASCAVTFSNLVMDVSAHQGLSPFTVTPGTETALTLAGTNLLAAGDKAAGLTAPTRRTSPRSSSTRRMRARRSRRPAASGARASAAATTDPAAR